MKIRFGNNVNQEVALLAYGDFIDWVKETSNSENTFFGYYIDGEPFCSGNFGEVRYSQFTNKL